MKIISLLIFVFAITLGTFAHDLSDTNNFNFKLDKLLKSGEFVQGRIYRTFDTINVDILKLKGRFKKNNYLECICRFNEDSIVEFSAKQINGFNIKGEIYIKQVDDGKSFFIHKIKTGRMNLYEREALPYDGRYLYYLQIPTIKNLFILNPYEKNISQNQIPDSNTPNSSVATTTYFVSTGAKEKFKLFVKIYFGDCPLIVTQVEAEFFTIKDLPLLVESYNNCF